MASCTVVSSKHWQRVSCTVPNTVRRKVCRLLKQSDFLLCRGMFYGLAKCTQQRSLHRLSLRLTLSRRSSYDTVKYQRTVMLEINATFTKLAYDIVILNQQILEEVTRKGQKEKVTRWINSRSVNFNQTQKPNWGSSCESLFRSLKNLSEHARLSSFDRLFHYLSRRASNVAICNTHSSKFMLLKIIIYYGITRHF